MMGSRDKIYLAILIPAALATALFLSWPDAVPQDFSPAIQKAEPEPDIPETLPQPPPIYIKHDVPFTSQAPFANWSDERYQNACEEASMLMAWHWIAGRVLSADLANQAIADMVEFERINYGFYIDSSAEDTARFMREYYDYEDIEYVRQTSALDIKHQLAAGNLVIVPANGRILENPNFTAPGPERHMLVIKGYDEERGVFITNDPGTRNGEDFEYSYENLYDSIRDYESGDHAPIVGLKKPMIVIGR